MQFLQLLLEAPYRHPNRHAVVKSRSNICMPLVINTNITSLTAQRHVAGNTQMLAKSMEGVGGSIALLVSDAAYAVRQESNV